MDAAAKAAALMLSWFLWGWGAALTLPAYAYEDPRWLLGTLSGIVCGAIAHGMDQARH